MVTRMDKATSDETTGGLDMSRLIMKKLCCGDDLRTSRWTRQTFWGYENHSDYYLG